MTPERRGDPRWLVLRHRMGLDSSCMTESLSQTLDPLQPLSSLYLHGFGEMTNLRAFRYK